jgi:hypothetical protein
LFAIAPLKMVRFAAASAVLTVAVVLVSPLSQIQSRFAEQPWLRMLIFYGVTAGAYAALPFIRRGDVAMVAMWLVLAVGVAPCFGGRELSATNMFADMGGVLMAAVPIYIARFRQVIQGDTRTHRRRETEMAA